MYTVDKTQGLTVKALRELLNYDPKTGVFTYKVKRRYQIHNVGDVAGSVREGRYLVIKINNFAFYAHRLAWLYINGVWPEEMIDHINGNKLDNRFSNLRLATRSQNASNTSRRRTNSSGYKGVVKYKNKWKAQITHKQKVHYLGLYDTKEEAHEAYIKAAKSYQLDFVRPS